ncbi:uncharacterized protein TNCV_3389391 [Trichonephila clavipes]|nr:uncharacterized protein TNCV_3389391 [Trichonephila clavipes]
MSPGQCNTGLTMPRHAEYQIINLILGILHHSSSNVIQSSGRQVEGVDGLQFVSQPYPTHALLNSSPNDIPIDVACHRYTLNMQVSSGTKNNSSSNEPSCTNVTVSFNGVLLVVMGTWHSPYLSPASIRLQTKPDLSENITQCCGVVNACSLLQVNRRRQ